MDYRREIDGLRALAIVPVILFHAGFDMFSGGFVGVDVFFVISGYLITTLILSDLERRRFSIVGFYERRARRILPALFLIMFMSLVVGYFTLMPDEFKNLGQSLLATSLFSNNVLLAITSGYWDLASEFKPLLHTWSLAVEEQYYIIFPIILLVAWRYCKGKISLILLGVFFGSLAFAIWFVAVSPKWAFYILPTRAWEISIGGVAALSLRYKRGLGVGQKVRQALSFVGLVLISGSVLLFDKTVPSPGLFMLVPTIGATLIILFAWERTFVNRLLSHRIFVFVGLISYSLYLWHQPVFAYLRAYFKSYPSSLSFGFSIGLIFALSYLTWRYIETPFRNKETVSPNTVLMFSIIGSAFFVGSGFYLNESYGVPSRVFDSSISIKDMDKRIYNERVFLYKSDAFSHPELKNLLVVGNSFARDFVNITLETYNVKNVEIVYRDDFHQCILPYKSDIEKKLFSEADVVVFASGSVEDDCLAEDLAFAAASEKMLFYVGTKRFGSNLNWLIRLSNTERRNRYNVIDENVVAAEAKIRNSVPEAQFISLLGPTLVSNQVPVTDHLGRLLSSDRAHLTKYGAIYFGTYAVKHSPFSAIFNDNL